MTRCVIGIDTGGTCTDAVVIDPGARRVVARAKALTTRGDLAVGIADALGAVLAAAGDAAAVAAGVAHVALSTTLATNAIVEGHGAPVGVILIGFDAAMAARTGIARAVPGAPVLHAAGGHDHAGNEAAPLDEAAIRTFVHATADAVAAYAVAAQYSVRNPAHERRARDLVNAIAPHPVTLSADLAQALDAPRRALTAALNARIIGRITALIGAVQAAMAQHGIAAPLRIVKGDGTLAPAALLAARPIETILSGPAASTIGAKFLSGRNDLVVADIGGTTTDIAVLEGGWPRLDPTGALVGGHRTLVPAIDLTSIALGGDSEVAIGEGGRIALRPGRVWPLALLGARFPEVITIMAAQRADAAGEPHAGRFALRLPGAAPASLPAQEAALLAQLGPTPTPLGRLLRGPLARRALDRLEALGLVARAGFTPTDAAHVLERQDHWSRNAAVLGALLFTRGRRMLADDAGEDAARAIANEVCDAVVNRSARALIETLAGAPLDGAAAVVEAAAGGTGRLGGLLVRLAPALPVVAVGGPAPWVYPEVGRRLGCEVVLPADGAVANAVGAAVAVMAARAVVEVSSAGVGAYRVHPRGDPIDVADPAAALALARRLAQAAAAEGARAAGMQPGRVTDHVARIDLPGSVGDAGLIAATVFAECIAEDQPPATP
jgi:N-methylhydantoinase A/oxoprolinase/acetone carboxylase beta subunit